MKYLIFIIVFMLSVVCNAQTYIKGKALIEVPATTATAAGTTTLTTASQTNQQFTGSTTQTVTLPDTRTLPNGRSFFISNRSSGVVTLNYNGGSLAQSLAAGTEVRALVISNATAAGTWDISYLSASGGGSGTVTSIFTGTGLVPNTITGAGTLVVDVGTTGNKIVQLTGGQLPAVDGFLLTNTNANNVHGVQFPAIDGFNLTNLNAANVSGTTWYILASFTGGDPIISNSAIATNAEITNSSLTLTPASGSAAAGTMCSATNAATAPSTSPTTCAAGNESLGINFAIPESRAYKICAYLTWFARLDSGVRVQAIFELVETGTNNQTTAGVQQPALGTQQQAETIATGTSAEGGLAFAACGIFDWSAVSPGTVKAVRLFYGQAVTGTPSQIAVYCDAINNRNCSFTVEKLAR